MINSRKIDDLLPAVAAMCSAMIEKCDADGIDLLVTSTYRDHEAQAALFAQGRTTRGLIVTNARPGESFHNWRVAFDVVPLRAGKPIWDAFGEAGELWERVGAIGESVGLEWSGRWAKFRELAHFQYTGGLTLADLQAGRALSA